MSHSFCLLHIAFMIPMHAFLLIPIIYGGYLLVILLIARLWWMIMHVSLLVVTHCHHIIMLVPFFFYTHKLWSAATTVWIPFYHIYHLFYIHPRWKMPVFNKPWRFPACLYYLLSLPNVCCYPSPTSAAVFLRLTIMHMAIAICSYHFYYLMHVICFYEHPWPY